MESLFITYYWFVPVLWIIVTILNRLLGDKVARLNRETVGYIPPDNGGQWNLVYVLRLVLFIPAIIYLWWFCTEFLTLPVVYLLISGYSLMLWVTAVIRQFSSLLSYYLIRRFKFEHSVKMDNPLEMPKLQAITSSADYFGYFLVYLIVTILTQSWFIAGGTIACLIAIIRHVDKAARIQPQA